MPTSFKAGVLIAIASAVSILVFSGCSQNTQPIENTAPRISGAPPVTKPQPQLVPKDNAKAPVLKPRSAPQKTKAVPAKKSVKLAAKKAAHIAWQPSFETALMVARKTQKPIMVDFFATWCGPCHFLAESVYPAPAMVLASKNFISVKVDVDQRPDLMQKYQAANLPTVAFLDASGKELSRQEGVPGDPQAAVEMLTSAMKDAQQKFAGTPA